MRTVLLDVMIRFAILFAVVCAGCDPGPGRPRKEAGPLPFSSPETPLTRLRVAKGTWNVRSDHTLWDEGRGPIEPSERIKELVDAVPDDLMKRLASTRRVPYKEGGGEFDQQVSCAQATVVSLHPDVMIVAVRETPLGSYEHPFKNWFEYEVPKSRREYIQKRRELITTRGTELAVDAGTLVPWSAEMYVFSTDPNVANGPLSFVENQSTVIIPGGKLVLTHHDDDVDVVRE